MAGLFGGAPAAPAPPPILPPTPMPLPDNAAQKAQKQRSLAQSLQQQGRASTILTDVSSDKLGG